MKTFLYTYSEEQRPKRNGHTYKTVRVYRVKRNKPVFLVEATDTFVDEAQLVLSALEAEKALPKAAFETRDNGSAKYGNCWVLREEGIADIRRIT